MNNSCYVIGLNENLKLLNSLKEKGLKVNCIKGIDGNKCDEKLIKEQIDPLWQNYGPKSAIGCAMSHMKTWMKFLESEEETCIIFEDDVIFDEYENRFMSEYDKVLKNTPMDFDILYIGCFGSPRLKSSFMCILCFQNTSI
jgi:GR25 family glycosyltransferase involved in LPS biosynthesis